MNVSLKISCLVGVVCLLFVGRVSGDDHDNCKDSDHTSHMGYARTENWSTTPCSTPTGPTEDTIYGPTSFLNCTCVGPIPINYTHARSRTHSVNVSGSGTISGKTGLALKILADAHANITLGGGWTGTWVDNITIYVGPYNLPVKYHVMFEHVRTEKYTASGTVETADCHFTCTRGLLTDCDDFCNKTTDNGTGVGWTTAERVRFYNGAVCYH